MLRELEFGGVLPTNMDWVRRSLEDRVTPEYSPVEVFHLPHASKFIKSFLRDQGGNPGIQPMSFSQNQAKSLKCRAARKTPEALLAGKN